MQDRTKEKLEQRSEKSMDNTTDVIRTSERPFQANKAGNKGINFPPFWKKKRLKPEFVRELERTANSEPVATDEHGEYRVGKFLHGCSIINVGMADDLWSLEIHSDHPIGLPAIQEIRYKFLPDDLMMAMLFLPRKQRTTQNTVVLYQIPGSMSEQQSEQEK